MSLTKWWKNVSIAKKLYSVVGIMTFLVAGELLTLRFAMKQLSAVRAFVGAESLWSKAQKNAVFSLQRYGATQNEKDFETYLENLKVPEGDHRSRMELLKKDPNLEIVRQGFLDGRLHPKDIDPVIELLRKFSWVSYLKQAVNIWTKGDDLLFRLKDAGSAYHGALVKGDRAHAIEVLNDVKNINEELTSLEEEFSSVLGEGSRWLENVVLTLLTMAVLTVESIGITLAFLTSRSISRGLENLNRAAQRIGQGDFHQMVEVHSEDEIGQLSKALNNMGYLLQRSYGELEDRVRERTAALEKMAAENAELYKEAKAAIETRDEFLSIASHELKTPITSLYLQMQRLARMASEGFQNVDSSKLEAMAYSSVSQAKRITVLLEELLDLTRLRIGKFQLNLQKVDIVPTVTEVTNQIRPEATRAGSSLALNTSPTVGNFDVIRIAQVVTNLLSNAVKYGQGKPITVDVKTVGEKAVISVRDHGIGIAPGNQEKLFERFERGKADPQIEGLGLGLYISQQIVKAHNGRITVESSPGQGSTFSVWI